MLNQLLAIYEQQISDAIGIQKKNEKKRYTVNSDRSNDQDGTKEEVAKQFSRGEDRSHITYIGPIYIYIYNSF